LRSPISAITLTWAEFFLDMAQQRALADAAAAEQADPLALPARQETVDRTDPRDQALRYMFSRQWIRGRRIQRIRFFGFDRRTSVHRLPESVQHSSEQARSDGQTGVLHARDHAAAQLQAFRFFHGH
jgi:hypothetical protein